MFTGLIEEIGTVRRTVLAPGGRIFDISCGTVLEDTKIDDSICVNGVCLTVTDISSEFFTALAVKETLERSTLKYLRKGMKVNLERALRIGDRLGGHFVQGHVDGTALIQQIRRIGDGWMIEVELPSHLLKYIVAKGSLALDGISLTIAKITVVGASIAVIPHTWKNTTLNLRRERDRVNVEVDYFAKYVEKFVDPDKSAGLDPEKIRTIM
jgi:riboflavin synthase